MRLIESPVTLGSRASIGRRPHRRRRVRYHARLTGERLEDQLRLTTPNPSFLSKLVGITSFRLDGIELRDQPGFTLSSAANYARMRLRR